jgi:hypothetical protein
MQDSRSPVHVARKGDAHHGGRRSPASGWHTRCMWTKVSRCWTFAGSYGSPRQHFIATWPSADALRRLCNVSEKRASTGVLPVSWKQVTPAYKISPIHRESQLSTNLDSLALLSAPLLLRPLLLEGDP